MSNRNSFWDKKKPAEETFSSKDDVLNLDKKIDKLMKQEEEQRQGQNKFTTARKMIGSLTKGLGDVASSLNTSENDKRMKISQMPGKKAPIATYTRSNPLSGKNAGIKRKRISDAPLRDD
jgi:hypothetical protein